MEAALLERMLLCRVGGELVPELPTSKDMVFGRLEWFVDRVVAECPSFTPVSLDGFVEMYKGPKKVRYAKAVDSLRTMPLRKRDSHVGAFVKREKGNFTKSPRPIQTRDPRYHASLGRFLKPAEHRIYTAIARAMGEDCVVTKGHNLDGVAGVLRRKWDSFTNPVALGLDATKFDAHVSAPMLELEHSVYLRSFHSSYRKSLARLLGWQLDNRGKAFLPDGKVSYRCRGKRMSGDMNTGLGNCIIMCAMVYSYARARGVRMQLANNGDDCVVFMEQRDLSRFCDGLDAWFGDLGFRMTSETPVFIFEQVEFCQMSPVRLGSGWRMVRKPRVALEKDTTCVLTISDEDYFSWLGGVSACGRACADGVPIMYEFYCALARESQGVEVQVEHVEATGMRYLARGLTDSGQEITADARVSFWMAFGISPDTQVAVEDALRHMSLNHGRLRGFVPSHWPLDVYHPPTYLFK